MSEHDDLTRVLAKLDEVDDRLAAIEKYLEKQKGFVGGVMIVVSGIFALATAVKEWWSK